MKEVKKVVLIGASGFVGSALLNETLNRGFEVTAVVRHPEKIKIENENLKVTKADVASVEAWYIPYQPDVAKIKIITNKKVKDTAGLKNVLSLLYNDNPIIRKKKIQK